MNQHLRALATRLGRILAAMGNGQKAVAAVAVVALLAGGLLFSRWAAAPTYAPLFTGLAPADASAVVDELEAAGTPHQLADGGGTVLVPRETVYDTRVKLSGKGLPAGDQDGYDLLDQQGLTTSEFQQQVGFQRAMEGELTKTVEALDGVQSAVVHLALPKKSVFADEEGKPSASVLVSTVPGKELRPEQVQAVVHLVSSSVAELQPDQVTVADAKGRVLSASPESGYGGAGDLRAQQTKAFEERAATDVKAMLEQVVGPGKAAVKVTADLDFDSTKLNTETMRADPKLPPVSETRKKTRFDGNATGTGGVLGPDNISVPQGQGGNENKYSEDSTTRNNAFGEKSNEERKLAPGATRKLAVSAMVDSRAGGAIPAGQLEDIVRAALGIDDARGDQIQVTKVPFDQTAAKEAEAALAEKEAAEKRAAMMRVIRTAVIALVILLALGLAFLRNRRKTKDSEVTRRLQAELELMRRRHAELEEARVREALAPAPVAVAELEPAPVDPEMERLALVRDEIGEMVQSQPDEVAQLLRGWLADRRS